ncbi:MAG: ABC transporter ATP-binding protein [Lachnospiraceae bacterium]|nr:ABC transporter ATP-binding protein [Lachnospiraceae bacterium]
MVKKLAGCLGEYKKFAILTPLIMVGEVVMEVLIPFVMAQIIDKGIQGNGGIEYTIKMGLLMIFMALVSLCFGALGGTFAARAGMGFAKNIRERLFNKVQDFSFSNIDKFSTASLVTRLTTDVTNTQNAFMMLIRMGVRAPFMLIGALLMSISINSKLSTVFLFAVPILAIALILISQSAYPRFREMLKKYDGMNAAVQENLVNIRVVKSYVRENHEISKFQDNADSVRKAQYAAEKLVIMTMPIMQLVMYVTIVAIIWVGGNMIVDGDFAIGQLSSMISYVTQILMSLMMLSMIFIMIIISRASMTRIVEVLDEEIDIVDLNGTSALKVEDGSIVFKNVCFSYSGKEDNLTLDHLNFEIRSGETIGIIGGTGSAKTTLVQLIPRLYDVLSGEVIVGGHSVKDYTLKTLREEVAMVLQKNLLFSGTIEENLRWGNEDASMDELTDACKKAQAHDFIMTFPDGYQTDLGQGAVNVSGGQKQRICIARALLKKPKILILDDSTSAVDTATDSKIRESMQTSLKDTTKIIIAQRITSVMDADKILVLDDGKMNGFGTHEELMNTNTIYREVYDSQQKGGR